MPRFFLHLRDDVGAVDEEGVDLPDVEAAKQKAIYEIRELVCDQVREGKLALHQRVDIEDEHYSKVATVAFAEAVSLG